MKEYGCRKEVEFFRIHMVDTQFVFRNVGGECEEVRIPTREPGIELPFFVMVTLCEWYETIVFHGRIEPFEQGRKPCLIKRDVFR